MIFRRNNGKKGSPFYVDSIEYIVVLCTKTKGAGNVAVLLCESGECVTVSNLSKDECGNYSWNYGYRARSYDDAVANYVTRITV